MQNSKARHCRSQRGRDDFLWSSCETQNKDKEYDEEEKANRISYKRDDFCDGGGNELSIRVLCTFSFLDIVVSNMDSNVLKYCYICIGLRFVLSDLNGSAVLVMEGPQILLGDALLAFARQNSSGFDEQSVFSNGDVIGCLHAVKKETQIGGL
eukprot:603431_1